MPERPIVFSCETGERREPGGIDRVDPVHARMARRFVAVLRNLGHDPAELLRPEIAPRDPRPIATGDRPVHLIFKPTHDIRILKGARNIGIVPWEEPSVRQEAVDRVPFTHQARMLGVLDEIWVPSRCVRTLFETAGLRHVHVVPCPVQATGAPASPIALDEIEVEPFGGGASGALAHHVELARLRGMVCVALFDTDGWRTDTAVLLEALDGLGPTDTLVVACRDTMPVDTLRRQVAGIPRSGGPVTGLVRSPLNDRQCDALFAAADVVIGTSRFEGQGLALLEGMARGCLAVTARHSGLTDILEDTNALLVETLPKRLGAVGTQAVVRQIDPAHLRNRIREAVALGPGGRAAVARRGTDAVARSLAPAAVAALVMARLEAPAS